MTIQKNSSAMLHTQAKHADTDADLLMEDAPENLNHQFQLIKGTFSPKEAEEILLELIHNKIKFHSLESLIILERYNGDTTRSQKRIQELKAARETVQAFLKQAREAGWQLEINSRVEIKVVS